MLSTTDGPSQWVEIGGHADREPSRCRRRELRINGDQTTLEGALASIFGFTPIIARSTVFATSSIDLDRDAYFTSIAPPTIDRGPSLLSASALFRIDAGCVVSHCTFQGTGPPRNPQWRASHTDLTESLQPSQGQTTVDFALSPAVHQVGATDRRRTFRIGPGPISKDDT